MIDPCCGAGVFDADALGASNNQIALNAYGGSLTDRDAFVRVVEDAVARDKQINTAFTNINSVTVRASKRIDAIVAYDSIGHIIEVDRVRVSFSISREGAVLDQAFAVFNINSIAGVKCVNSARAERDR